MSPAMSLIYDSITELMDACVRELRKTNKLDTTDLTVEQVGRQGGEERRHFAVVACIRWGLGLKLPRVRCGVIRSGSSGNAWLYCVVPVCLTCAGFVQEL
jgi:hypothetical protein